MREFFCMACDYIWSDLDHKGCPECQSMDVADGGENEDTVVDYDGHYEGNFTSSHFPDDWSG